jgi:serine/threonine-protein kinase
MSPSREVPEEVIRAQARPAARFGKYVLLEEIGRGGMSRVFRAWDTVLGRIVALKMLKFHEPEDLLRFRQEAQLASRLDHPGIVRIHETGDVDDKPYISMQHVDGASLEVQRLPVRKAVEAVRDAARAIAYAHERGVVHRDLKPGNLLVSREGRVHVTDFGLAKRDWVASLPRTPGTPSYMSPEQARGEASRVGPLSDVFALGSTLYGLLAGRPPFLGGDVNAVLRAVATEDPPSLRGMNAKVPMELETVVLHAMEKETRRRYETATALADDLDRFLQGEAVVARRPGFWRRFRKRLRPALVVLVAGVVAGLGAASAYWVPRWQAERLELDAPAYSNRAAIRLLRGDAAGARDDANRAIELAPDHAETYATRGRARAALNDLAGALEDYSHAIALRPDDPNALQIRGFLRILLVTRDLPRAAAHRTGAIEDLERALQLAPADWSLRAQTEQALVELRKRK